MLVTSQLESDETYPFPFLVLIDPSDAGATTRIGVILDLMQSVRAIKYLYNLN
jgi:hypothetical protein